MLLCRLNYCLPFSIVLINTKNRYQMQLRNTTASHEHYKVIPTTRPQLISCYARHSQEAGSRVTQSGYPLPFAWTRTGCNLPPPLLPDQNHRNITFPGTMWSVKMYTNNCVPVILTHLIWMLWKYPSWWGCILVVESSKPLKCVFRFCIPLQYLQGIDNTAQTHVVSLLIISYTMWEKLVYFKIFRFRVNVQ